MFSARKASLAPLALSTVGLTVVALLVLNPAIAYGQSPLNTQPATAAPAESPAAQALGVVVRDVRIEGLQRIEPGTVFSYLPIQIGDRVTEQGTAEAVRVLFATGFLRMFGSSSTARSW